MTGPGKSRVAGIAALLLLLAGDTLAAQGIAERVRAVGDGVAELRFAGRNGVCGDGRRRLSVGNHLRLGERIGGDDDSACLPGPVRVRLTIERGRVRDVRSFVGPVPASAAEERDADLGTVPAREAASYFIGLASAVEGRAGPRAILPAVLADSATVWRDLLRLARDTRLPRPTRTDAAHWLSRFAAARVSGHGEDIAAPEPHDDPDDARIAAVFALSQLRQGEGIAPLIQVARTNRDAAVRRQALFWLGQSGDPRALDAMEEMLGR